MKYMYAGFKLDVSSSPIKLNIHISYRHCTSSVHIIKNIPLVLELQTWWVNIYIQFGLLRQIFDNEKKQNSYCYMFFVLHFIKMLYFCYIFYLFFCLFFIFYFFHYFIIYLFIFIIVLFIN